MVYDTVIVGGGPAGLAAALALGVPENMFSSATQDRHETKPQSTSTISSPETPRRPPSCGESVVNNSRPTQTSKSKDAHVASITGDKGAFQVESGRGASSHAAFCCAQACVIFKCCPLRGSRSFGDAPFSSALTATAGRLKTASGATWCTQKRF